MTDKLISVRGPGRVSRWHENEDCSLLKVDSRQATQEEIDFHGLRPCWSCSHGDRNTNNEQDYRYQNARIDSENDPLNRVHDR